MEKLNLIFLIKMILSRDISSYQQNDS